jgi:peptidoglycan hydrolase CwlO-like protein
MLETNPESVIQVLGSIALAVIVVFVSAQKLLKDWRSGSAEGSVITLMHTELERMAEQNTQLSTELGRLHGEVIALNQQLQKLTVENQRLQLEVVALTREVTRLQSVLHKGELNGSTN